MQFQALNPSFFFAENQIFDKCEENFTHTWNFIPYLYPKPLQLAKFNCNGLSVSEACPPHLKSRWVSINTIMQRHIDAIKVVSPGAASLERFIPKKILFDFLKTKNDICSWVFTQYPDPPPNQKFLYKLSHVLYNISNYTIRIENIEQFRKELERKEESNTENIISKAITGRIGYNIFSSKTGRIYLKEGSFPLYTLKKEYRKYIVPHNELFVELDFNGAEIRTLLSLSGVEQPNIDIHDWNKEHIFQNKISRDKAKEYFFSWLYNSKNNLLEPFRDKLESIYQRDLVKKKYWSKDRVTTVFNRSFESNEFKALNGICQSTTADVFAERLMEIYEFLQDKKTKIAFIMLDAVILDVHPSEINELSQLKAIFEDTSLGKFKANFRVGKNYGEMISK